MRSYLSYSRAVAMMLLAALVLSGCAAAAEPEPTPTALSESDLNTQACENVQVLWDSVYAWGTTPGNSDENGRPVTGVPAPDFRLELDAIRQETSGTLRTALDEYFDSTPTMGSWWYANNMTGRPQVVSACGVEGVVVGSRG